MSITYPDLLSNFPDGIDTLTRMSDLTYEDMPLVNQYYAYCNGGHISEAQALLNANPSLKAKIFNAEKFNLLADGNIALQRFFMEKLQDYLNEQLTYTEEYDPNKPYKKTNIISFNGEGFICRVEESVGVAPVNGTITENWALISKQGVQGTSGTGLAPRSEWKEGILYYKDDCVAYNNVLWQALNDNTDSQPSMDNANWFALLDMTVTSSDIIDKGQPNGVAELDENGEVPTDQVNAYTKPEVLSESTRTLLNLSPEAKPDDIFLSLGLGEKALIKATAIETTTNTPIAGVLIDGIKTKDGRDIYTDSNGEAAGYSETTTTTIGINNKYIDIENCGTKTITTPFGEITKVDINARRVTENEEKRITSSKDVTFAYDVNIDIHMIGSGSYGDDCQYHKNDHDVYEYFGGSGGHGGSQLYKCNIDLQRGGSHSAVIGTTTRFLGVSTASGGHQGYGGAGADRQEYTSATAGSSSSLKKYGTGSFVYSCGGGGGGIGSPPDAWIPDISEGGSGGSPHGGAGATGYYGDDPPYAYGGSGRGYGAGGGGGGGSKDTATNQMRIGSGGSGSSGCIWCRWRYR